MRACLPISAGWAFFDLRRDRTNVVILELAGRKFDVVVVEVKDAQATTQMIREAISSRAASGANLESR